MKLFEPWGSSVYFGYPGEDPSHGKKRSWGVSQLGAGFKVPVGTLLKGLLISIYGVIGVPLDTRRYLWGL